MNWLNTILLLCVAFVAVFLEAVCDAPRRLLGAQVDLLPALMVYASLRRGIVTVALLAVFGGLWQDALSANPPGVSILPLFAAGFLIYPRRGMILRDEFYARFVLGVCAGALVPFLTLLMLLSMRLSPLLGWGTIWQFVVLSVGGGLLTPFCFWLFETFNRALMYRPAAQSSFRPDREIRRGRN